MHDIQQFRANLDAIVDRLAARGFSLDRDQFLAIDQKRRTALTESQQLAAQINAESKEIGKLRQAGQDTTAQQDKVKAMKQQVADLEQAARDTDDEFLGILKTVPNVPHESVPTGKSADDNVEVRREGTARDFDFEPKAHWDLGPALGILDFERAAKITGARFAVYWDMGAKLERALANFMLDTHGREHGYREVMPPVVINSASLYGTGQLPKFAEDLFRLEGTDYWLAPTAEVPVTNLFRDETLDVAELPIKLCAYTSCFRSEAGAYGRDVRGIIRQHQFQKVELVKFTTPDQSLAELEALTHDAEDILRKLGLPFRTVLLCTGDMGFSSCKTYDIEVWLPSQREFKEISSCSCFGDFQARRANIRQRNGKKTEFLHTLNGSGLAVGRTWVAIIENYQQADGSVLVPEALRPYLNTDRLVPAR